MLHFKLYYLPDPVVGEQWVAMPLPFQDSELDADLNIESMPALALTCSKEYGTSSFFEQVEQEQVELYRLAVVDEATGIPMRIATATDIAEGFEFFTSQLTSPKPNTMTKVSSDANVSTETAKEATKEDNRHMTLQELLATRCSGPECDHCGALGTFFYQCIVAYLYFMMI